MNFLSKVSTCCLLLCSLFFAQNALAIEKEAQINHKNSLGQTPLMLAASGGVKKVKLLLENGAHVNAQDNQGYTPLLYALSRRDIIKNVLKLLLEKGANVSVQDRFGYTPLMIASMKYGDIKDEEIFDTILNNTQNIEAKNRFGETALFMAVRQGYHDIPIQRLLAKGADITAQDKDGTTLLMLATKGHIDRAQILIAHGIDVNVRDNTGKTALMHAMIERDDDVRFVPLLHQAGADIHAKDTWGNTALYYAAAKSSEKCVKALLDLGAPMDKANTAGKTALDMAIEKSFTAKNNDEHLRYVAITKLLDPSGKKLSTAQANHINERNKRKYFSSEEVKSFLEAAKQGHADKLKALLDKGISANAFLHGTPNAIVLSIAHGRPQILELLLDNGADVTKTQDEMRIYFMGAARDIQNEMRTRKEDFEAVDKIMHTHPAMYTMLLQNRETEPVERLIASGADINFKDKSGKTPLMLSIIAERFSVARLLIEKGADVNIQDVRGNTALMYAADADSYASAFVSSILEKKPDITLKNKQNHTALFYAEKKFRFNRLYDYDMDDARTLSILDDYMASLSKESTEEPKNTASQEKPAVPPTPVAEKTKTVTQELTPTKVQQSIAQPTAQQAEQPQAEKPQKEQQPVAQPAEQQAEQSATTQTAIQNTPSDLAKATPPAPKKPGIAVIVPTKQDFVGLEGFEANGQPDSHIRVIAQSPSPLTGILVQNIKGKAGSWKTKQAKGTAQGVLLVQQNGKPLNNQDAPFSLDVAQPVALDLFMQDTGAINDTQTRIRVIFFHEDGSRLYSLIQR